MSLALMAPAMRLLQSCDKGVGLDVLVPLAQQYIDKGSALSFDEIWQKLGATLSQDGKINYDGSADSRGCIR